MDDQARLTRRRHPVVTSPSLVRSTDLDAEHETLRRQVEALHREHARLTKRPYNQSAHEQHRQALIAIIKALRAHRARIRAADR